MGAERSSKHVPESVLFFWSLVSKEWLEEKGRKETKVELSLPLLVKKSFEALLEIAIVPQV